MRDRLEEMIEAIIRLNSEVGRSPENCSVQDILFSIHAELVSLRKAMDTPSLEVEELKKIRTELSIRNSLAAGGGYPEL